MGVFDDADSAAISKFSPSSNPPKFFFGRKQSTLKPVFRLEVENFKVWERCILFTHYFLDPNNSFYGFSAISGG